MTSDSIGKFMCELRKEKGLTQKDMAEQLGVSDKTISKWETGRGIPDTTILNRICDVLCISVVELLSGERMVGTVNSSAEDVVESLLMKKKEMEKEIFWRKVGFVIGFINLALIVFGVFLSGKFHFSYFLMFLDIPSLIFVLGLLFIGLCLSGQLRYFLKGFELLWRKEIIGNVMVEKVEQALLTSIGLVLLSGFIVTLIQLIIVSVNLIDYFFLLRDITVALIAMLYGAVFGFILWIIKAKIHTMYK